MITISHGVGNQLSRSEAEFATVGDILDSGRLQADLGFDPDSAEVRVNGNVVDRHFSLSDGMRVRLSKRAGGKSNELMNKDQQLEALPIKSSIFDLIDGMAAEARDRSQEHASEKEKALNAEKEAAKLKVLEGFAEFPAFVDKMAKIAVAHGSLHGTDVLELPASLKAELKKIDEEFAPKFDAIFKGFDDCCREIAKWKTQVIANLHLCTTVDQQRALIAKVAASDPLKPWVIKA